MFPDQSPISLKPESHKNIHTYILSDQPLTHSVIELHNEVVGRLVGAKLQVHHSVNAQLGHSYKPPGTKVLPALGRGGNEREREREREGERESWVSDR